MQKMEVKKVGDCLRDGDVFRALVLGKHRDGSKAFVLRDGVLSDAEAFDPVVLYTSSSTLRGAMCKFGGVERQILGAEVLNWDFWDWVLWLVGRSQGRVYEYRNFQVREISEDAIAECWVFARTSLEAKQICEKNGYPVDLVRLKKVVDREEKRKFGA